MITQVARTDGLALRASRPRALGRNKTRDLNCECDERAYTYHRGIPEIEPEIAAATIVGRIQRPQLS